MKLSVIFVLLGIFRCGESSRVITVNAVDASTIVTSPDDSQYDYWNAGSSPALFTGWLEEFDIVDDNMALQRCLLRFRLGNFQGEQILEANLKLSLTFSHEPCSAGCGTVHRVTTPWNGGSTFYENATNGEVSWIHGSFPDEWVTPGGDFDAQPIGTWSTDLSNFEVVTYSLDLDQVQTMIDGNVENYGFIIITDETTGSFLGFESEGCLGSTSPSCVRNQIPQLELTIESSPGSPTRSPLAEPSDTGMVSLNATEDANILFSPVNETVQYLNVGRAGAYFLGTRTLPSLGITSSVVFRGLLRFEMRALQGEQVAEARLVLSRSGNGLSRCSQSEPSECGTVHALSTPWTAGNEFYENATEGESSWIHSDYPDEWSTPGGDFFEYAMGRESPDMSNSEQLVYDLDTSYIQRMVDDPSQNLGFLLRHDSITGFTSFESITCSNFESTFCPRNQVPRLDVTFSRPTSTPTIAPTTEVPTLVSTGFPTKLPTVSGILVEASRSFQQSLILGAGITTINARENFRDVFESELEQLSSAFIDDTTLLTAVASIMSLEFSASTLGTGMLAQIQYTLSYEQPLSIVGAEAVVQGYPDDFIGYFSVQAARLDFERNLRESGLDIQLGSLSEPMFLVGQQPRGGKEDSINIGIIAGAAAGGFCVILLGGFLLYRRKRRSNGTKSKKSNPVTDRDEAISSNLRATNPRHSDQRMNQAAHLYDDGDSASM